jgi:hypothetical protein
LNLLGGRIYGIKRALSDNICQHSTGIYGSLGIPAHGFFSLKIGGRP